MRTTPDYDKGYKDALLAVSEFIWNAETNSGPAAQHYGYEIIDQLIMLADDDSLNDKLQNCGV